MDQLLCERGRWLNKGVYSQAAGPAEMRCNIPEQTRTPSKFSAHCHRNRKLCAQQVARAKRMEPRLPHKRLQGRHLLWLPADAGKTA